MPAWKLKEYIAKLEEIGVEQTVFGFPQNLSIKNRGVGEILILVGQAFRLFVGYSKLDLLSLRLMQRQLHAL